MVRFSDETNRAIKHLKHTLRSELCVLYALQLRALARHYRISLVQFWMCCKLFVLAKTYFVAKAPLLTDGKFLKRCWVCGHIKAPKTICRSKEVLCCASFYAELRTGLESCAI